MKKSLLVIALFMLALSAAQAQKLTAAGATFPYPIYSKWFNEYSAAHPGVEVNYQSIGSGGGIKQVSSGTVDFGASDMPMTDDLLASCGVKLIHIPTVLGADVPVFNVPGVDDLRFSPDVLGRHLPGQDHQLERSRASPRTTPVSTCPTRRSSSFIVRMAAAPPSSGLTT